MGQPGDQAESSPAWPVICCQHSHLLLQGNSHIIQSKYLVLHLFSIQGFQFPLHPSDCVSESAPQPYLL